MLDIRRESETVMCCNAFLVFVALVAALLACY
jgi:hypothetical protein